jgi:PPE-repeat protein
MATPTLKTELDRADPNNLADMLRKVALGSLLDVAEYDTGTITASADVTLPGGALVVQSARVVTSGTAASVGLYLAGDAGITPLLPPGGASAGVGYAKLSADGKTLTFPNTVTRVIVRYIKQPAVALSTNQ